jgi:Fic family protein
MDGLLLDGKVGGLRKNDVYIIDQDEVIQYVGPEAATVSNELSELLDWLNNSSISLHPVIVAGLLHLQFVSIHTFSDGNGRTTRALTSLYLGLRDYDFRGSLVLDSYYSVAKRDYYSALHTSQGNNYAEVVANDVTFWMEYFTGGFLLSAKVLLTEITLLSSAVGKMPIKVSHDEIDILAYAKQFETISLSGAEGILPNVARRTLQRKLNNLVDRGYLKPEGKARNTVYRWSRGKKPV